MDDAVNRAQQIFKFLSDLKKKDMALLLRTNWTVGGVVIDREKKETIYGDRTMLKIVKPDGKVAYEYADRLVGGTIEDCIFRFKDAPIILTERKVPTTMDDLKYFNPIMTGNEARMFQELINDINIKHEIIHHLSFMIKSLRTKMKVLESKADSLGDENRYLKDEIELLRKENIELKRALSNIRKVAEMAIKENMAKDRAIEKILNTLNEMSTKVVMTPTEAVDKLVDDYVKQFSKMEAIVSRDGKFEGVMERLAKLESEFNEIKNSLNMILTKVENVGKQSGSGSD